MPPRRAAAATLSLVLSATPAAAQVLTWQMSADESQVNNYDGPPGDGSTDSTATGMAEITYDPATGLLSWDLSWTGLEALLSAIHVHGPADAGRSNTTHLWDVFPVAQDVIDAGVDRTTGSTAGSEPLADIVVRTSLPPVDPGVVLSYLYQDLAYVNIHSEMFPMGEIRASFVRTGGTLPADTRAQGKCADSNDKNLLKVASKRAKELRGCVKDATKGKGAAEPCIAADPGRATDKATDKTQRDFQKKCWGMEDGAPRFPLFGATEHAQVNAAGVDEEVRILRALFGDDLDTLLSVGSEGKCQLQVLTQAQKCEQAALKEFRACAKRGRKDGTLVDLAGLVACVGADPKGKVEKACDARLRRTIEKKCPADPSGLFLSLAAGPVDALVTTTRTAVDCQVCRVLDGADALGLDCELYDDGAANASCPEELAPPPV